MALPHALASPGGAIPLAELRNAVRQLAGPACNGQCVYHCGGAVCDKSDCEPGQSGIHDFIATDNGIVGIAKKRARSA